MSAPLIFTPDYYRRMRQLESEGWWNAAMRDVSAGLLRLAALPSRGRMLDVGCGSGQTMSWFATHYPQWQTLGLDISEDGLNAASQLGETVLRASALALPVESESIDLVVTLDVVQHLPLDGGDRLALAEMYRVLRPGGYLLLRTNAQALPHVADDREFNFHKYRRRELAMKLARTGFQVRRCSRINALLGLAEIPRELRAARRRTGENSYSGILAHTRPEPRWSRALKRRWLRLEGAAVRAGLHVPLGRTVLALCRK